MAESPSPNPATTPIRIEEEMRSSYLEYAMSVIIGRALPDVRDGLKPVHRRILYAMYEQSNTYNRAYKKSARIVGDVIGKYHPHGDSAVYDALVRMAQNFSMRMPLVDGQGNFGSVDGDPAAAMRYTEVRMTRACSELLEDIEKDTVEFGPNYDGSEREPLVLPTRIPNLLVNGAEGIAVGMATRIPPHNPGEVIRATIALIDNPAATLDDLMAHLRGPDFPTAGLLLGIDGVRQAYETGRGSIRIRGRAEVETHEKSGKQSIIVTELPFQVNKARLLEKIAELVREKAIEGITDLRDESDRKGMRMVIELRRDAMGDVVLNQLFRKTTLETTFGVNMLAIVNGQPRTLSLREMLSHFIDHRRDVVTRRCLFELRKARERLHILQGLRLAVDQVDAVIREIRASRDVDEARERLIILLGIDTAQAQAILDLRLQRLTNLEIHKIIEEIAQIEAEIARLSRILSEETEMLAVIRSELAEVLAAHSDARRTEIVPFSGELSERDLIPDEPVVVAMTRTGYIKRTPVADFRLQKRGGKGLSGFETKEDDVVSDIFVTHTHADLLIFSSRGKVYPLQVFRLPAGGRTTRGRPIVNLIPVEGDEKVAAVFTFNSFDNGGYIFTATRSGVVKKTALTAYRNIHSGGIIGVEIPDGDELITARVCHDGDQILLVSAGGQCIRFASDDVRPTGRATMGVIGIRFREDDHLASMVILPADVVKAEGELGESQEEITRDTPRKTILTVTQNGYGKRTAIAEYPVQGRGGIGVITIKTSERNGDVCESRIVDSGDELMLTTDAGQMIRTRVSDISVLGRNTQGVRIIHLEGDERVVAVAVYDADMVARYETEATGANAALDAEGAGGATPAVDAGTESETADAAPSDPAGSDLAKSPQATGNDDEDDDVGE